MLLVASLIEKLLVIANACCELWRISLVEFDLMDVSRTLGAYCSYLAGSSLLASCVILDGHQHFGE